jgi:hypothetical protein
MSGPLRSIVLALAVLPVVCRCGYAEENTLRTTVGIPARIDQIVLPGPELIAKPQTDARAPVVLRVVAAFRHGSDYRYDLEYYGLDPGTYDLRDYLVRKDGTETSGLPPIHVVVSSVLPPGQIEPNQLLPAQSPKLGGYRLWAAIGLVVWALGLLVILFARRRRRAAEEAAAGDVVSLADRLLPLVSDAAAGRLPQSGLAELERLLLAFWRRRLNLEGADPAAAIAALRRHPEAGELLRQLDAWLHRPGPAAEVDVESLLRPYRTIPADDAPANVGQHA